MAKQRSIPQPSSLTWAELNNFLRTATEAEAEWMLGQTCALRWKMRIWSRFNKMRAEREKVELRMVGS